MLESNRWRAPSRYMTLIAVAALHAGALILLLMASSDHGTPMSSYGAIELLSIPTPPLPRIRAESGHPARLRADIAPATVLAELPAYAVPSAPSAMPSSGTGSHGKGVDWMAEAHRALRAYEIRRDNSAPSPLSGKSPANDWWPQHGSHTEEQFKTAGGDWIVWISPDCYKVASWHTADPAVDSAPPQIICPGRHNESGR